MKQGNNIHSGLIILIIGMIAVPCYSQDSLLVNDSPVELLQVNYSKEQLDAARRYIPGGEELSNEQIRNRLEFAWREAKRTNHKVQIRTGRDSVVTEADIRRLVLQQSDHEVSRLDQRLVLDGKVIEGPPVSYSGQIINITMNGIAIKEDNSNREITLDLSGTPRLPLPAMKSRGPVKIKYYAERIPEGKLDGSSISDADGLLFAAEVKGSDTGFAPADLGDIRLRQREEDLKAPAYQTNCSEVYFPSVMVDTGDEGKEISIDHGMEKLVKKGNKTFLIRIIRSQYNKQLPCNVSFEELPWRLEFVIIRIDDASAVPAIQSDTASQREKYRPDAPKGRQRPDPAPNPRIQGGDN